MVIHASLRCSHNCLFRKVSLDTLAGNFSWIVPWIVDIWTWTCFRKSAGSLCPSYDKASARKLERNKPLRLFHFVLRMLIDAKKRNVSKQSNTLCPIDQIIILWDDAECRAVYNMRLTLSERPHHQQTSYTTTFSFLIRYMGHKNSALHFINIQAVSNIKT